MSGLTGAIGRCGAGVTQTPVPGSGGEARRAARTAALAARARRSNARPLALLPSFGPPLATLLTGLSAYVTQELDDRRGFLFLPIAIATGAALYFGAEYEPLPYAALVPVTVFTGLAIALRARAFGFHLFALLAAISAGFALASFQVQRIAHPVLPAAIEGVEVAGFVEAAEQRPRGSRITLRVTRFGREGQESKRQESKGPVPPQRVRVTLTTKQPPAIGAHVALRASLAPPPGAAYPGGFDFGRSMWFDGIGAAGFALGRVQPSPPSGPLPLDLTAAAWLDGMREAIAGRIRSSLSGAEAGVAVALVTGLRDGVPEAVEESMRVSGLSHILSISGLHMALVATTVFFVIRALLALSPATALRFPIKAWAAIPAALAASFYLLLSGAEVPTQRAYAMTLIVLAGVVLGRPALTLRTLAVAALAVLVLTPWAILDPGAQMSFAATLALVAAYERWGHLVSAPDITGTSGTVLARALRIPIRYIAALVLTSLAAGLATAPYAAFHFQRLAPLSLVANLAAMPVVSLIVMPAGLVGSALMPFGWDGAAWRVMGWGIGLMARISEAVAAVPGADRGIPAMPAASMMLLSVALVATCLLRTRLLLVAPLSFAVALWLYLEMPRPDVLIDREGRTVAVRGADGRLAVMGDRSAGLAGRFVVEQWLSAEGERSRAGAPDVVAAAACDPLGCTLRDRQGGIVALSRDPASLEEDCRRARLLITRNAPPAECAATVIRIDPRQTPEAMAAFLASDRSGGWRLVTARGDRARPWEAAGSATGGAQPHHLPINSGATRRFSQTDPIDEPDVRP
ncbi:ComEC/Rec2 family competence protein [Ancylobacter sp. VNQ12]|uniref:ComEC/Rec2 family competence protein n=1 Tax=Ancylobacter sp. VNQ12 TaxID=3400920 RepID=UPI003C0EBD0C